MLPSIPSAFRPTISIIENGTAISPQTAQLAIYETQALVFQPIAEMGLLVPQIQKVQLQSGSSTTEFALGPDESPPAGLVLLELQLMNVGVESTISYDVTFTGIILDEASVARDWTSAFTLTLLVGLPPNGGVVNPVDPTMPNFFIDFSLELPPSESGSGIEATESVDELVLFLNDVAQMQLLSTLPLTNASFSSLTFLAVEGGEIVCTISIGAMQSMLPGLIIPALVFQNIGPSQDGTYQVALAGTVQNGQVTLPWCFDPEVLVKSTAEPGGSNVTRTPRIVPVLASQPPLP